MKNELETFRQWITEAKHIVFLGGAGVSTESGIPDFRSADGLYNKELGKTYPPEEILSDRFFRNHTREFYDFYRSYMIYEEAEPNAAHKALAHWEKEGKLDAIITQNIDGLHQKAGSVNVLEVHGTVMENECVSCHKEYPLSVVTESQGVPRCEVCNGLIKPKVVLYGESLDMDVLNAAVDYIRKADLLIVGGTSLRVYPAAGLIDYYRGNRLVLVNKEATDKDRAADLIIHEPIGQVFSEVIHQ